MGIRSIRKNRGVEDSARELNTYRTRSYTPLHLLAQAIAVASTSAILLASSMLPALLTAAITRSTPHIRLIAVGLVLLIRSDSISRSRMNSESVLAVPVCAASATP